MARPRAASSVDLTRPQSLTVGLIERLVCPPDRHHALLRDGGGVDSVAGLKVRVTATGAKSFVYEARIAGKAFSRTLGQFPVMSIKDARSAARALANTVKSERVDPREVEREEAEVQGRAAAEKAAQEAAQAAHAKAQAVTVGDAWPIYLENGKGKRAKVWKPRYLADLKAMAAAGGVAKKRGTGLTRPGPLHPLMSWTLASIHEDRLAAWHRAEAEAGPHQAARALMMFRGFLRWCSTRPEYRDLVDRGAAAAPAVVENLPTGRRRTDALESAQVAPWWDAVTSLPNNTASVYLRALLLTGARREELAALTWDRVDFQWRRLTIADKVDATRVIPLSPYLAQLLATLPRTESFVFASTGKTGRIADARASHVKALAVAGIDHLTIHGLRRSFSLLGEAAGAPAGALAQIMGHKPSAVAEGYRPRSVDALRPYIARVEEHVLTLAGVQFVADLEPGKLRAV
nr:integrase family protein [Variovorax boronicumulans]